MKKRTRRWLALVVVCAVAGGATAVASAAVHRAAAQVTLTLTSINTYQPGFTQVIKNFEHANPSITINPTYGVAGPQYTTQVATQFAGGSGDDLVYVLPGNGSADAVWPFAKQGYLLNLSTQSWVGSMYKPVKSLYSLKGKVYSWDLGSSTNAVLNYNMGYFATHSLSVPTTFSQLLTLCGKIAALGQIPIAWGAASSPVDINNVISLAGNTVFAATPNWLTLRAENKTTFANSPGWKQALAQIGQMQNAKCFQPGVAGVQLPQMLGEFGSGQAAMMFTYGGLGALVNASNPSLKIGQFNPPGVTAKKSALTLSPAGGLSVWSKSPHVAAAEAFLKFLAQPTQSEVFATLNDLISPKDESTGHIPAAYAGVASYFKEHRTVPTAAWEWPNTSMENLAGDQVAGLFTGQSNSSQVLAQFDTDWTSST